MQTGKGKTKQEAKNAASMDALDKLKEKDMELDSDE